MSMVRAALLSEIRLGEIDDVVGLQIHDRLHHVEPESLRHLGHNRATAQTYALGSARSIARADCRYVLKD